MQGNTWEDFFKVELNLYFFENKPFLSTKIHAYCKEMRTNKNIKKEINWTIIKMMK